MATNKTISIQLVELTHQTQAVNATLDVFWGITPDEVKVGKSNPNIIENRVQLEENVSLIQADSERPIPTVNRGGLDKGYFGIDIHMETGTGKTYVYAKTMLEMHKKLGVNKFVVVVPTLAIKQGAADFLTADYVRDHFSTRYNEVDFSVNIVQSSSTGKKITLPTSVTNFVHADASDTSQIHVLIVNSGMLKTGKNDTLNRSDYDQTLFGRYNQPYAAIAATNPVVIIDEPHRFKRNNSTYKVIEEKIKPQVILRYGATFPEDPFDKPSKGIAARTDYNNLVFSLGALESFNRNLVKGVDVRSPEGFDQSSRRFKLMKITPATRKDGKPKLAHFIELAGKDGRSEIARWELKAGDSLTALAPEFAGLEVDFATREKGEFERIKLAGGQEIYPGGILINTLYADEYQKAMVKQAIEQHFEQETSLFFRGNKIKALTLFFIDSVASYQIIDESGTFKNGRLALQFEELLEDQLRFHIEKYSRNDDARSKEYVSYLQATLNDLVASHGGYFSGDLYNKKNDQELEDKINQILKDKQRLISFKNPDGTWNTMRFIFSKWALREGWDNPNVFQIAKLRSSGSEISKLQEVGRGLRLPVDENGVRIDDDEFHLIYFVDYSERDFAEKLILDINGNYEVTNVRENDLLQAVAKVHDTDENTLFTQLLTNGFINFEGNIVEEKREEFLKAYPDFSSRLRNGIIRDNTGGKRKREKLGDIGIRKDNFEKLRLLWESINKRYIIDFEDIDEKTLNEAIDYALSETDDSQAEIKMQSRRTVRNAENQRGMILLKNKEITGQKLDKKIPYGLFLKDIAQYTNLPVEVIHRGLVRKNAQSPLSDGFFTVRRQSQIKMGFDDWFIENYLGRYSYKRVDAQVKDTALTDASGMPKDSIAVGRIGVIQDDETVLPTKFLYDKFVYDSDLEKDNITEANRNDVDSKLVVFGKIPRKSIRIPRYFGGTTSPDFMFVLSDGAENTTLNFVVETKSHEKKSMLTDEDKKTKASARAFFDAVHGSDDIHADYYAQLKSQDLINLINKHLADHGQELL